MAGKRRTGEQCFISDMVNCDLCGDEFGPLDIRDGLVIVLEPVEIDSLNIFSGRLYLCSRCAKAALHQLIEWTAEVKRNHPS